MRAPFVAELALDVGEAPIAALALPDEPKEPAATLPPVADPVMPPVLCELLPTLPAGLPAVALETSLA
ncbi:MAG: hypothetical protein KGK10_00375 [Rhodospirillales bacterium]|nr:hypothetical protein [Rhodospirillales bacterium]